MSLIKSNDNNIFAKGVIGNVRTAQEDCHGFELGTPNGDLFVVCDGMGGHVGGAMASRLAVDSIIGYISKERYATPIEALNGALQFANMQILGYADAHSEYKGMGTTACIVLMQESGVWIAHVGDSRIYLYLGKEKRLFRITKDHSYVQSLVDGGVITDEEAEHHPQKNRIMKALGIKLELSPSFNFENRAIHPKNGDVFLICSDGLCGMISDHTIKHVLGERLTLQQKGDQLVNLAMEGEIVQPGGQDNCTLELIEIDNSPYNTSEFKSYNPEGADEMVAAAPISNNERSADSVRDNVDGKKPKIVKYIVAALVLLVIVGIVCTCLFIIPKHRKDNTNSKDERTAVQVSETNDKGSEGQTISSTTEINSQENGNQKLAQEAQERVKKQLDSLHKSTPKEDEDKKGNMETRTQSNKKQKK
ncbi:MAG: serine/threonine-protein phosphatase [Bacteroidales bacterium]|nr:serine/threonine-protein phosphatase [Bacteroidales bacterium]